MKTGSGGGSQNRDGPVKSSYVGIASSNTSVRDKKNLLEIRLERSGFKVNFNLTQRKLDHLLTRLGIDSSHFLAVSCFPRGQRSCVCYSTSFSQHSEVH